MASLNNTCVGCECNATLSYNNRCFGVYCDFDTQCATGKCYLGFCTPNKDSSDKCTKEDDAPCGKCANIGCDNDRECYTGECNDYTHKCYDPIFWIVILLSTLGALFLVVGVSTCLLVRKRRA